MDKFGFQNPNIVLFLGCCVVALGIVIAGFVIAGQIPDVMHGSLHGSFSGTLVDGGGSQREFMSEWEAAGFLLMTIEQFRSLAESGELTGTYAVFQVERYVWEWEVLEFYAERAGVGSDVGAMPVPAQVIAGTVIEDHRVFSRERLSEWLIARME